MSSPFALSPRAAVVLAAVVAVLAIVVVLVGARDRGDGAPGAVLVTRAPVAEADGAASTASPGGPDPTASPGVAGSADPSAVSVVVHVAGAVRHAGLVTLPAGSRVSEALDRAGGAERAADLARLNLARVLVDGERLWVPRSGETEAPAVVGPDVPGSSSAGGSGVGGPGVDGSGVGGAGTADGGTGGALVDLNTADSTTLETLPGIGPALAARILAWRTEHGRFTAVEDLLDVSGIGDAKFADLQHRVRV